MREIIFPRISIELPAVRALAQEDFGYPSTFVAAEGFLASVHRGTATAGTDGVWVEDAAGAALPELSTISRTASTTTARAPLALRFDGVVVLAATPLKPGRSNYYHWMFEVVARLALLRRAGIDFDGIEAFLVSRCDQDFHRESLAALGVPLNRVVEMVRWPRVRAGTLLVPSPLPDYNWPPRWTHDLVASFGASYAGERTALRSRRIYLRRGETSRRPVLNDEEVARVLATAGFDAVALERLSIGEQIALFRGARVVIAPHGAGLTNIAFCSPDARVVEIFTPSYRRPLYRLIAAHAGLDYWHATAAEPDDDTIPLDRSMTIPRSTLELALSLVDVDP